MSDTRIPTIYDQLASKMRFNFWRLKSNVLLGIEPENEGLEDEPKEIFVYE